MRIEEFSVGNLINTNYIISEIREDGVMAFNSITEEDTYIDFHNITPIEFKKNIEIDHNGIKMVLNLKYVHQVQNLYLILKNEELDYESIF